jgi:hypothetical protein
MRAMTPDAPDGNAAPSPEARQCDYCIWRLGSTRKCIAFLKGIPADIWRSEFDHRKPYLSRARTSCTRINARTSCTTGDECEPFHRGDCGCASTTEGAGRATGVVLAQPGAITAGGRDARRSARRRGKPPIVAERRSRWRERTRRSPPGAQGSAPRTRPGCARCERSG